MAIRALRRGMRVFLVAAFAEASFRGNPAGVCILPTNQIANSVLQSVATELNQPETAFLSRSDLGWRLRWFSARTEIALCGHATLAAAHVLWSRLGVQDTRIGFATASGPVWARKADDMIWLDFPAIAGEARPAPADVLASVDREPVRAARHADRWVFEYDRARDVRDLQPDFARLRQTGIRSLIVTSRSDAPEFDIVSRNFAPIVGVDEDQVTGAAHCCLGPYWRDCLGLHLRCWQASRRGGALEVITEGERVQLGGRAVIELDARWVAPDLGL